jgi:hypothetical protein
MRNKQHITVFQMSRQGHSVGRKYTFHTPHPSRTGRYVRGLPVSTNIMSLTGHVSTNRYLL